MRVFPFLVLIGLAGCDPNEVPVAIDAPPVADAGPGARSSVDLPMVFDGRASYDPEGKGLVYHWTLDTVPARSVLTVGSGSAFLDNHSAQAGTTRFQPDAVGVYVVKLVVEDEAGHDSAAAYVVGEALAAENLPVAHAGQDMVLDLGQTAVLSGLESYDPRHGSLSFDWALTEVPPNSALTAADLLGSDTFQVSLVGDVAGRYTVNLVVDNGVATSTPDTVVVRFVGDNALPVADAGLDLGGEDCTWIELDCRNSYDPEGVPLDYFWEIQSRPAGSRITQGAFEDRNDGYTRFWPDVAGTYEVSCSVFDGEAWSLPDAIAVDVDERAANVPPIADAGRDRLEAMGNAECTRSGSSWDCDSCPSLLVEAGTDGEASDADGDPIEITWTVVEGRGRLLGNGEVPVRVVLDSLAPRSEGTCAESAVEFELRVVDCPGAISTDHVRIIGECCGI